MNGFGCEFLSGAGLAAQQDRAVRFGYDRDLLEQPTQRGAIANDAMGV
ncbi:hypothetical protein ACVWW1_008949 [Bradyrhizobium sp. JR3.5]